MRRNFHFLGELTEDGLVEHDRDEVRQTLLDLEGAVYQLGGVITMSAVRHQIGDDAFVTTGVVIAYDSFSPAVKQQPVAVAVDESEEAPNGAADTS
jgi:hypothetical protein